ncbi:hypothetical protein Q1695_001964 [Nippostrongylus brasiliensis]|nr:hypothetical protein Q1695_001964 [Nippostrongylus brasiliensis]
MLSEVVLQVSTMIMMRLSDPGTTIQIPEANRSLFQYYGVPTGFYNEIYFKEALKQVNSAQDTVNAANLCKIYGTDDLYYEYSVRFKELVRDLLYYSMTTVCADLVKFDVAHSVTAANELISLLDRIVTFIEQFRHKQDLGEKEEVDHDLKLLRSILRIFRATIHQNALPYRSFPDAAAHFADLKSRQIRKIVMKNKEDISEKYASIIKEHELLSKRFEDRTLLRLVLFRAYL